MKPLQSTALPRDNKRTAVAPANSVRDLAAFSTDARLLRVSTAVVTSAGTISMKARLPKLPANHQHHHVPLTTASIANDASVAMPSGRVSRRVVAKTLMVNRTRYQG